ncbi:MAG: hypothetical protein HY983_02535 [Candidatus Magasanikbacteria bacterium]|nr:hypothetical protein [Candidatus Magasanikbacteria bacterium]
MNDTVIRHVVSAVAALICLLAYVSGYVSGGYGWWWTGAAVIIVYGAVYKIIDAGGHH